MPIRGFDVIKQCQSIVARRPLALLKDTIITIDGFWFVRKYMLTPNFTTVLTNGIEQHIHSVLEKFLLFTNKQNIQILWIWDGLCLHKINSPRINKRKSFYDALECYERGDLMRSSHLWKRWFSLEDVVIPATNYLKKNGVNVIRAPYTAAAQSVYFYSISAANYIFGSNDLLLFFETNKIITDFCFMLDSVEQIELTYKEKILQGLKVDFETFQNFCLLLGCEYCPTVPQYATNFDIMSISKLSRYGIEPIKRKLDKFYGTDDSKIVDAYIKNFKRAKIMINTHPVMSIEGSLSVLGIKDMRIEEMYGRRLPDICYEKLFLTEIEPEILNFNEKI